MKQVIIGTYYMGAEYVQIVLRDGDGAEFYITPEHGKVPRMKIGADRDNWHDIVAALLHEALELCMFRLKCRYSPSNDFTNDHSAYLFIMDHCQFTDMCCRAGEFLSECEKDLRKAWRKWKKESKKKK